ncbi:MAG: exo-alpha-sialidase [Verrucomicrobiae bacterium]|nr:exo-alpha-sialidase [Verrucomicrobiae bacterium]
MRWKATDIVKSLAGRLSAAIPGLGRILGILSCLVSVSAAADRAVEGRLDAFLGSPRFEIEQIFTRDRFPNVVVARDGSVLAFWNGVVVRRSEDGGQTWGDEIPVGKGFMGGGVIVDESSGDILAFVEAGHPPSPLTVHRSRDHGRTWQPQETVVRGNQAGNVPAMHMNERGITLRHGPHRGRLIRPSRWYADANYPQEHWPRHYTDAIYSDDGGKTWQASEPFPVMGTGEAAIVELSDGRLYYNSRRHWAPTRAEALHRWVAWSSDGGATWTDPAQSSILPDGNLDSTYGLMGGLVRLPVQGRDILVFSNIDSAEGRRNGMVWASFDGGRTWPVRRGVHPGSFAYSSIDAGRPGTSSEGWIYLFFEGGPRSGGTMARFNLAWLLGGEPTGNGAVPGWLAEAAVTRSSAASGTVTVTDRVRLMTYNLWIGGESGGQPLTQSALVIQAAQADIVGLQEGHGQRRPDGTHPDNAAEIAKLLGWNHAPQVGGRSVLSRFPIAGVTAGRQGAIVVLPSGRHLHVFNVHLAASPYQPYQLLRIPYGNAPFLETADALVEAAEAARGAGVTALLDELVPRVQAGDAVVLTGDFNEPSHQDWTPVAVAAGLAPMAVPYPTTRRIVAAGMTDAYRAVHPDPVTHPAWTWTPITREDDPEDRHDRIDMIFTGPGIAATSATVVGERPERADIVVRPYPSDHRAVVAVIELRGP